MSKAVKEKAKKFLRKYKIKKISFQSLKAVAEKIGYTVIEFNSAYNDEDVATIINNLNIQAESIISKGFTYADKNYRLIFINESLNEEEKLLVLSHELGHIECGHLSSQGIIGKDVKEEYEANEFSHHLLHENLIDKSNIYISEHKRLFITLAIVLLIVAALLLTMFFINKEKSYYGDYYVTSTGNKYHEKECIFVKDKTNVLRLTKEMFESEEYEACNICLP